MRTVSDRVTPKEQTILRKCCGFSFSDLYTSHREETVLFLFSTNLTSYVKMSSLFTASSYSMEFGDDSVLDPSHTEWASPAASIRYPMSYAFTLNPTTAPSLCSISNCQWLCNRYFNALEKDIWSTTINLYTPSKHVGVSYNFPDGHAFLGNAGLFAHEGRW